MIKEFLNGKFTWPKFIIIFVIIWLITFFVFKDNIKESKIYKAKMGVFKAMLEGESTDDTVEKIYEVMDSTFNNKEE